MRLASAGRGCNYLQLVPGYYLQLGTSCRSGSQLAAISCNERGTCSPELLVLQGLSDKMQGMSLIVRVRAHHQCSCEVWGFVLSLNSGPRHGHSGRRPQPVTLGKDLVKGSEKTWLRVRDLRQRPD